MVDAVVVIIAGHPPRQVQFPVFVAPLLVHLVIQLDLTAEPANQPASHNASRSAHSVETWTGDGKLAKTHCLYYYSGARMMTIFYYLHEPR